MAQRTLLRRAKQRPISMGRIEPSWNGDVLVVRIPGSAISFDAFRKWTWSDDFPEEGRISYVEGEVVVDMSHEELATHALAKAEIIRVLGNINVEERLGKVFGDGARVVNAAAAVSNIPDTVFVSHASLKSGFVTLTSRKNEPHHKIEVVGSPDLAIEIVGNSSVVKDVDKLRTAYHAAGILEYWLIDARGEEIVFQILNYRRDNYVSAPNRDGWVRSRVFRRDFQLVREIDESDLWEYRLNTRVK